MAITADKITEQLHREIDQVPAERRASLLKIIHAYREAVEHEANDIDPEASIRRGFEDVRAGRLHPIETLWDGIKTG
jgi:hypothetical protein